MGAGIRDRADSGALGTHGPLCLQHCQGDELLDRAHQPGRCYALSAALPCRGGLPAQIRAAHPARGPRPELSGKQQGSRAVKWCVWWVGGVGITRDQGSAGRGTRGGAAAHVCPDGFHSALGLQEEQHRSHENCLDAASDDLLDLQRNLPEGRSRSRELEEYRLRKEHLEHEVSTCLQPALPG